MSALPPHFALFEQFETAPAGVLDDGIPALRMYVKQDDRIGLSIPTTANSKAIIKQVKRALQVAPQKKLRSNAAAAAPSNCSSFLMQHAEHWWEKKR